MLSVICFSKDRPLQLDAFLDSLHFFSSIPFQQIAVIYAFSAGITYDEVIAAYPDVVWIKETDFVADFRKCVEAACEFVMLCCDDMVFKEHFAADTIISALKDRPDALAFTLRLGANLHWLPRLKVEGDLLSWNWRLGHRSDWYFPWDVSGSVYRREFVLSLLDRYHNLGNPNRLEMHIAYDMPYDTAIIQSTLLCFRTSKAVVLTINRVQDEFRNTFDGSRNSGVATLHAEYLAGKRLYWPAFAMKNYRHSHINGRDFVLAAGQPTPPAVEFQRRQTGIGTGSLALRIAFWSFANLLKQSLRAIIPARLFNSIRKSIQGFND